MDIENQYDYRLSAIRLQNFMAFEDTGWIELRPITLLFGRNSSGKSAIIRALLLLKQSIEARDLRTPLIFNGRWVDLGSFYNAVHRHEINRDITFGFRLSRPPLEDPPQRREKEAEKDFEQRQTEYERRLNEYKDTGISQQWSLTGGPSVNVDDDRVDLELTFGQIDGSQTAILKRLAINGWRKRAASEPTDVLIFSCDRRDDGIWQPASQMPLDYEREEGEGEHRVTRQHPQFSAEFWPKSEPDLSSGPIPKRLWLPDADPVKFLRSDRPPDWEVVDKALEFFHQRLVGLLTGIVYLPPLREEPRRYYRADHEWVREIQEQGADVVNKWLQKAGITAQVRRESLSKNEGVTAIYLEEAAGLQQNSANNIRDVGSGISQAIPILARTFHLNSGALLIVEQPELHLHPAAQAELADYFKWVAKDRHATCLLETHSSAFLNRFRRRIAEKDLATEQIVIIFVERKEGQSQCRNIPLSDEGEYVEDASTFESFFSTDANELTLMKLASLSSEERRRVEETRKELMSFEHLFDGEKVDVMFAILGIHPASAIRMMRVWAEYVTKVIAYERGLLAKDNADFAEAVNKLAESEVFDTNIKRLANAVRQSGNDDSHASFRGIAQPSPTEACHTLENLLLYLQRLERQNLIPKRAP